MTTAACRTCRSAMPDDTSLAQRHTSRFRCCLQRPVQHPVSEFTTKFSIYSLFMSYLCSMAHQWMLAAGWPISGRCGWHAGREKAPLRAVLLQPLCFLTISVWLHATWRPAVISDAESVSDAQNTRLTSATPHS